METIWGKTKDIGQVKRWSNNEDLDKNFELAEEFFESSIRLNDDFESQYNRAESSQELGNLLTEENRKEEAKNHLKSADKVFKSIKKNK